MSMGIGWTDEDGRQLASAVTFLADIAVSAASIAASLRAEALRADAGPAPSPDCEYCEIIEQQSFGDAEPQRLRILRALPDPPEAG